MDGPIVKMLMTGGVGWSETEQIYRSGEPGWHSIDTYPGIYQGTEMRPANGKLTSAFCE